MLRAAWGAIFVLMCASCDSRERVPSEVPTELPPNWRSSRITAEDCPEIARSTRAELAAMLHGRRYRELETRLTDHRDAARANRICEANLFYAFDDLSFSDQDLPALDAWVEAKPDSVAPRAARALALKDAGYVARGGRFASNTPPENFERMKALHSRALADADRAIAIEPSHPVAYSAKIAVLRATGSAAEARRVAAALFEHNPASYAIYRQLIEVLDPKWGGSLEEVEQLAASAQRYVDQEPRLRILLGFAHAYRGEAASREEDWPTAVAHYSMALQHGDFSNEWSHGRGRAYAHMNQMDKALADYERAIAVVPDDAVVATEVARLHFLAGSDTAIAELTHALDIAPPYAHGFATRGWMHQRKRHWNEAAADYERAIELGWTEPETAEALGYLLYHDLDRPADAESVLRRSIEIHPNHPMLHFVLAGALDRLGRKDEARARLSEFLVRAEASDDRRVLQTIPEAHRILNEEF